MRLAVFDVRHIEPERRAEEAAEVITSPKMRDSYRVVEALPDT